MVRQSKEGRRLLKVLFLVAGMIIIAIILSIFVEISRYLSVFNRRPCKHCHKVMEYKGRKGEGSDSHYLFHCENCGAWEQIPVEEI